MKAHLAAHLRHVSGAAARRANLFLARVSLAVANVADIQPRETQLLHRPVHGFGKRDVDLIFQIAAGLAFLPSLRGIRSAKKLAEEVAETGPARAALGTRAAAKIESAEIEMDVLRSPAARSPLPGPEPPPAPGVLNPNWSYIWRFLVSESTSYASWICLNFSSADLSPGFRSG